MIYGYSLVALNNAPGSWGREQGKKKKFKEKKICGKE